MQSNNKHSILRTENLAIGYRSKKKTTTIASDINFELEKGQLVGLVGANGIGKSTLLRTLIKVQSLLSGDIFIADNNLSDIPNKSLAKLLSIVLTESLVSKNLTVFELIALGRYPYTNWIGTLTKEDTHKVNETLGIIGITDLKDRKCYELSDGQLQKVMIARALAQDTDLIILDEPTTHLDMYHKAFILKLLKRLTEETNKTILFSSHEINLAIQLCDSMIVMGNSKVITGEPCQLIANDTFNTLFPKDMIVFDAQTGSFKITK